jgi:SAM-dependent methyltransferase
VLGVLGRMVRAVNGPPHPLSPVPGAEKWARFYTAGGGSVYPDENLIRLVKGQYAEVPRSGRVLDVGFGGGGNLLLFAREGYEAHGLEVCTESLSAASALAERESLSLTLGLIDDTPLRYPDEFFDVVVSWNAVYYFERRSPVASAIDEFHRVLRRGGVLLLSVIHPNSFMVRRMSNELEDGARRIDREDPYDNRFGSRIFYDGTSTGWRRLLGRFDTVEEGYAESDLFAPARRDAWRLFLARKSKQE